MSAMKMNKERYVALDTARGVAIVMIVTCHFLLFDGLQGADAIGRAMANTGNFLFFAISAILFGLQLEKKSPSIFTFHPFLTKRLIRLFASLWPFLLVLISIYLCLQQNISVVQVIINFIGLGWVLSIPCNGHLWFVTMIIFCYLMYIFSAKFCLINHANKWGGGKNGLF